MSKKFFFLMLFVPAVVGTSAFADELVGLADITVVNDELISLRYEGKEYIVADGDLALGTTTRWYVVGGVEILWLEGDPVPPEAPTVPNPSSNAKVGDVGSKADNFFFRVGGSNDISSIDGINFQETIFPFLTDTIFVLERNGNDNGTAQAILADGSLGTAMTLTANGPPYASTGVDVGGQTAYGYVVKTDVPVQGVRITAEGHDTLTICMPAPIPLWASKPNPADGAIHEATWATLTWSPGDKADSHNVYLGDNFDDVNDADNTSATFRGNQTDELVIVGFIGSPYPDGLIPGTTYYWRIDEVNDSEPNSPWIGEVWSFTIPPRNAYAPIPSDGARYVDIEPSLVWQPGLDVKIHNVVFGDNFDDVNSASAGSPETDTSFEPGTLEKGKTYYWRIDELNPPTTTKGAVWSFTTIPDIPVSDPNLVAWYKFEAGEGTKVIDFSGHDNHGVIIDNVLWVPGQFNLGLEFLGDNEGHVELPGGMVTTASGSIALWVNTDQTGNEGMFWYGTETNGDGFGGQNEVHIHNEDAGTVGFAMEGSIDVRLEGPMLAGAGWNHVAATWDTVDGCRLYFNGVQVDFQAHTANIADLSTIRLGRPVDTGNGNRYHDGLLDDVRLFDRAIAADQVNEIMVKGEDPSRAGSPSPRNSAVAPINLANSLTWSAGEGSSQHDVYFGTNQAAVADADASDTTGVYKGRQSDTSYVPDGITMESGPFYWRVDEVANDGTIIKGSVWSFSVTDYALVDDFESYNDIPAGDPGSNLVYVAWTDGFDNPNANGSTIGYVTGASMESGEVHGGRLSAPMAYNNTTAGISEVARNFSPAQDWTANGVTVLSLWFFGDSANTTGQLYVKINGIQVNYNGAASDLSQAQWNRWNIDLTTVGTNLQSVTSFAVGIQGAGATGTLLLDDIELYRSLP